MKNNINNIVETHKNRTEAAKQNFEQSKADFQKAKENSKQNVENLKNLFKNAAQNSQKKSRHLRCRHRNRNFIAIFEKFCIIGDITKGEIMLKLRNSKEFRG